MRKLSIAFLLAAAFPCLSGCAGLVDSFIYPHVFQGIYDGTFSGGGHSMTQTEYFISDGHGRVRYQLGTKLGWDMIDYPKSTAYRVLFRLKLIQQSKFDPQAGVLLLDSYVIKALTKRELGSKVIDGRSCHGYRVERKVGTTEVWLADDGGYPVEQTDEHEPVTMTHKLKSLTLDQPEAKVFTLPEDYTVKQEADAPAATTPQQAPQGDPGVGDPDAH